MAQRDRRDGYARLMGTTGNGFPLVDHGLPPLGRLQGRPGLHHIEERHMSGGMPFREITGAYILSDESGEDLADIPYVAQVQMESLGNDPARALVVAFGGGPFFSPIFLNYTLLGGFGVANLTMSSDSHPTFISGHPPAPACAVADTVFMESTETGPKGDGPDGSRVFPGVDRRMFWGVERHAEASTAAIEQTYYQFLGRGRPLILIVSSYMSFPIVEVVKRLAQRGIKVDGLVFLSGHYDYHMQNYEQEDDPLPFATVMPQLALANAFHQRKFVHPLEVAQPHRSRRLRREVEAWAMGPFIEAWHARKGSSERRDAAERMAAYLSPDPERGPFTADEILRRDLRIDPIAYTAEYFEGTRQMSLVDPRYVDPPYDASLSDLILNTFYWTTEGKTYDRWRSEKEVDVAFKEWIPYFERTRLWLRTERFDQIARGALPDARQREKRQEALLYLLGDEHHGVRKAAGDLSDTGFVTHRPLYDQMEFKGPFADRRLHEPMAEMVSEHPELRIMHCAGEWDAMSTPKRTFLFWEWLQRAGLVDVHESRPGDPYKINRGRPDVDVRIYNGGHILGMWESAGWELGLDLQRFFQSFSLDRDLGRPRQGHYDDRYLRQPHYGDLLS